MLLLQEVEGIILIGGYHIDTLGYGLTLKYTVKNLNIGADRSQQTVQTPIRLLSAHPDQTVPKEQSDQGLHYTVLPFHLVLLNRLLHRKKKERLGFTALSRIFNL